MSRHLPARLAAATALAFVALSSTPAAAIDVEVVNDSGVPDEQVWLSLTNGSSTDGQLQENVPKQLSALTDSKFALGNITAGRLFVSYGAGVTVSTNTNSPIRNDKIEFTNPGVVNLTSVDFFGIPMDVQTLDGDGGVLETLAFRCHTSTINPALLAIPGASGAVVQTASGGTARIYSPQLSPSTYPLMTGYLAAMTGQAITLNSTFYGTPLQTTNYTGTFQPDGSITLTGTLTQPPSTTPVQGKTLRVTGASMLEGVYTGNGTYTLDGAPAQVSDNDVYAVIYRDLVAGFALGYWGGRYGNVSGQWNGQPPFAAAWASPPAFTPYFHQYAATIQEYSDAYGFSFSDVGPDRVQAGLNAGVAGMRVTIDSDTGPNTPGCAGSSTPTPDPSPTPTPTPPTTPTTPSTPSTPSTPGGPTTTPTTPGTPKPGTTGRAKAVLLGGFTRLDRSGHAQFSVRCTGDPCKGELTLTVRERVGRRKVRMTEIGRTTLSVREARSQVLHLQVSKAGRKLLRRAGDDGIQARATVRLGPRSKLTIVSSRLVRLAPYTPAKPERRR